MIMQISHEKARALIQFSMDRALDSVEENALSAHLQTCVNCVLFKDDLTKLDTSLHKFLSRHSATRYKPLAIGPLTGRVNTKQNWLRPAVMAGFMVMVFIFTWQFSGEDHSPTSPAPYLLSSIPTPSISTTYAALTSQGCKKVNYIIQEGDTLEDIASFFKVSTSTIKSQNDLSTANLKTGNELVILVCGAPPSQTIDPYISTVTLTSTALLITLTR